MTGFSHRHEILFENVIQKKKNKWPLVLNALLMQLGVVLVCEFNLIQYKTGQIGGTRKDK